MWYSHKESGVAVDLNDVRFLSCAEDQFGKPCIYFYFLDGKSASHEFQSEEQRQEVFDGIGEGLKEVY